jgi:hypothetical protein
MFGKWRCPCSCWNKRKMEWCWSCGGHRNYHTNIINLLKYPEYDVYVDYPKEAY